MRAQQAPGRQGDPHHAPAAKAQPASPSVPARVARGFGRGASLLWEKSRIAFIAIILAALLVAGFAVDAFANGQRIYAGVSVGDVDVSGMTVEEAAAAIDKRYSTALGSTTVFIFGSQETADSADIDELMQQQDEFAEQISYEDAQSSRTMWMANASTLDAFVPAHQLADEAFAVGREGRFLDRIAAASGGWDIAPGMEFDAEKMDSLIENIDATLGTLRVEWGIEVVEGKAHVTEGHDGEMMDSERFIARLTDDLLMDESARIKMVAEIEPAPIRIDEAQAQVVCAAVNEAIAEGASFSYEGEEMDADRIMVGTWVTTDVEERQDAWRLLPYLDPTEASLSVATALTEGRMGSDIGVRFEVSAAGEVTVIPDSPVIVPALDGPVAELDESLFGAFRQTGEYEAGEVRYGIPIDAETTQGPFTFDDALANGIITRIATYTTTYNDTASTQNRKFNIHRVADVFQNTIIERDGGVWSFNEIAGDCNEAAGYKDANTIMDGELVEGAGGGICQVATTVFNCVYDSGFPILERYNHTLHMGAYPDGRDAAVSYPTLDLRWSNDSNSDVLMRTGYSETTVTISLYGVDPGYEVSTEVGEWKEGEEFKTRVKVDEELASGTITLKTVGTDGMQIYVIRTVTDANGQVVREDRFDSVYSPVDKIFAIGPDTPVTIDQEAGTVTKVSASADETADD